MADQQIEKGTIYADGNSVDADNLNNHVDNAILLSGAITAQPDASALNQADSLLMLQGGALCKGTVSQMKTAMSLGDYVTRNGTTNTGMVTNTQLTLGTTTQLSALDAVSLGHLSVNYLKNSSALQTLTGSLALTDYLTAANSITAGNTAEAVKLTTAGINFLTTNQIMMLKRDPVEALEAVPKQYVDASALKAKVVFSGRFADTANGTLTGTYNSIASGSVTCTFPTPHGLLIGHRFAAVFTGTNAPAIATIFVVNTVTSNLAFTATAENEILKSATGSVTLRKCLIHSSVGTNKISNIIYCGDSANDSVYAVNLTNTESIDEMNPVVTPSILTYPETTGTPGGNCNVVSYDASRLASDQVSRRYVLDATKTIGFAFSASRPSDAWYDCGYRSGIVIY